MDTDVVFVAGLIIAGFSFPSIVGAFSEGRAPRTAALLLLLGGGMVAAAIYDKPGMYSLQTVPDAFVRVVGKAVN